MASSVTKQTEFFFDSVGPCCDSLGIPLFAKDSQGRFTFVNAAFCSLFGLSKEDILGKNAYDFCPRSASEIEETDRRVLQGESVQRESTKVINGTRRTFIVRKEPIVSESGEITGLYGVMFDVTERMSAYRELQHLYSVVRVVRSINQMIARETNLGTIFQKACEYYTTIPRYASAFIVVTDDPDGEPTIYYCGYKDLREEVRKSMLFSRNCWMRGSGRDAFIVSGRHRSCSGDSLLAAAPELQWIVAPMIVQGEEVGMIAIGVPEEPPSYDDLSLLKEIAGDLSVAIRDANLKKEWLKAREALERSERRYRTLVERSRIGIATIDSEYRFVYLNGAACEILGVERETAIGRDFRDFLAKESKGEALQEFFARVLAGEDTPPYRLKVVRPDGTFRYVDLTADAVENPDGVKQFVAQGVDVTERELMVQQMGALYGFGKEVFSHRDEQKIARLTVETAKELLGLWDCAFYIVDEGGEKLNLLASTLEIPPEFHELDMGSPKGIIVSAARQGKMIYLPDVSEDPRFIRARPNTKSEVCVPVMAGGKVLGVINSDMTREDPLGPSTLKALETLASFVAIAIENARLFSEAEMSELKFRSVAESSVDAIVVLNQDGEIVFWNNAASNIFGYRQEEVLGMCFLELPLLNVSDRRLKTGFTYMITGSFVPRRRLKLRCVRKDGAIFPCEASYRTWEVAGKKYISATIRDITGQVRNERELRESHMKLRRALESLAQSMEMAIELRDPYTAKHQSRVARLATAISAEMGLPQDRIEGLKYASLLHDIGKLSVPTQILAKPTKLSEEEFALIKSHPKKGYDILKQVDFPWPVAEIVYQHHERLDGSGYPRGLKGDEILLEARILAVADVVDAMVSYRPYRPALGLDKALEEISKGKGRLYDPNAVEACLRLFGEKEFSFE